VVSVTAEPVGGVQSGKFRPGTSTVRERQVHAPRETNLVLATHGRGTIWIIDDIRLLLA